jgi:hypothetical protein
VIAHQAMWLDLLLPPRVDEPRGCNAEVIMSP